MTIRRALLITLLLIGLATAVGATELSIFAASSLRGALCDISQAYEKQHPETTIRLNLAGSQTLAMQIEQGASADLFIAANSLAMNRLEKQQLVNSPQPLLQNRLILAMRPDLTPPGSSLIDLARPNLLLAIGNQQVPIGRYTRELFSALAADPTYGAEFMAKIEANIVTEERRVKAIIAKLLLGEVDAGFVYRSDLTSGSSHQLTAVSLPERHNPQARYPLAKTVTAVPQIDPYIAFLSSATAQEIFLRHGFSWTGAQ